MNKGHWSLHKIYKVVFFCMSHTSGNNRVGEFILILKSTLLLKLYNYRLKIHEGCSLGFTPRGGGEGGVMPYMFHTETCRRSGYTFRSSNPRQCLFSSLTLKQGAKFVRSLQARVPIHSTVWHPPVGFNLFVFCPGN